MGMRHIHAVASRTIARALDAAYPRSTVEIREASSETWGEWLPSRLEPPM